MLREILLGRMKKGPRAAFTLNLSHNAAQGLRISRRRTIAAVNIRVYLRTRRIRVSWRVSGRGDELDHLSLKVGMMYLCNINAIRVYMTLSMFTCIYTFSISTPSPPPPPSPSSSTR